MVRTIISDFARTLLFPRSPVNFLQLNEIHKREIANAKNVNVYQLNHEDLILKERVYNAEDFFEINTPLLEMYKRMKAKNISLILFTNSYIPTHPDYQSYLSIFDQIINVNQLGNMTKKEPIAYRTLCDKYNIIDTEALFIDDDEECIKAANSQNIRTLQFPKIKAFTIDQLFEELNKSVAALEIEVNKLL